MADPDDRQVTTCRRVGAVPDAPETGTKLGVASNVRDRDLWPLNGLRHPPEPGTNGWFVWAGEDISSDEDFFSPLHVEHVTDWRPEVEPYLALPPGWRFLLAPGQDEVWFDDSLLDT